MSGKFNNDSHPKNMHCILITLFVFHLEISGKDDIILQLKNMPSIFVTLFVFQFEISGKNNNDSQSLNK